MSLGSFPVHTAVAKARAKAHSRGVDIVLLLDINVLYINYRLFSGQQSTGHPIVDTSHQLVSYPAPTSANMADARKI